MRNPFATNREIEAARLAADQWDQRFERHQIRADETGDPTEQARADACVRGTFLNYERLDTALTERIAQLSDPHTEYGE